MEERKHYRLSPSATSRWVNCPGSLALSEGIENVSSSFAEEGTQAHGVGESILRGEKIAEVDPEMLEYVRVYTDFIQAEIRNSGRVLVERIETTLEHSEIEGLGGTADYFALCGGEVCTLYLCDLKYGIGVEVEAVENQQLLTYAVIIDNIYPHLIDEVELVIVQPRTYGGDSVKRWKCSIDEVRKHRDKILDSIGKEHRKLGEHCRWCLAKRICPEMNEQALAIAQAEFANIPTAQDVDKLVHLFSLAPAIKTFLDDIHDYLLKLHKSEVPIPGYKMVESLSHRRWKGDELYAIEALAQKGLSIEQITKPVLKTPAVIEKEFKKSHGKDLLDGLTYRAELGHKLVPIKAKGEAIDVSVTEFDAIG